MKKLSIENIFYRIEFLPDTFKYVTIVFKMNPRSNFDMEIDRVSRYLKGLKKKELRIPIEIYIPGNARWNRGPEDIKDVEEYVKQWAKALKLKAYVWSGMGYIIK